MSEDLAGKVALVTGGARNIGRAICRALAEDGASVLVNALSSRAEAEETVELIRSAGGNAALHIADITDPAAVAAMAGRAAAQFGRIDFLVNNASTRVNTALADISPEEWRRVLAIMLDGAFLCAQACLPHMKRAGGGAIVNLGGMTAYKGAAGRAHVVTAKAGLAGFTRALAHDLAEHNITVNCVVPGTIATERGLAGAPEHPAGRHSVPPIGRMGEPEEVAAMVRMLCGPGSRYITGQSFHVNGGGIMP
jgi:3-oxoacyl-[acyl-carrier protein] reductase